ncbi:MAG: M20/M25/M40 family metallo-hydrolase, partial [Armatimonadota bacterium]
MNEDIEAAVQRNAYQARQLLKDMIRFESTPGNEAEAVEFARSAFVGAGCECELVPIPEEIVSDPEYSHADKPVTYQGRANLVARRRGTDRGRSVILQSHLDVVPGGDWEEAFEPADDGYFVVGRGAADAKGQIAAVWLAMRALDELGVDLAGEIQVQAVV